MNRLNTTICLSLLVYTTMQALQRFPYPPSLPAEVPEDLLPKLSGLRDEFGTDKDHLKHVTDHFVKELERGSPTITPE